MKKVFTLLFVLTFALTNVLLAQTATVTIESGVIDDSPVDVRVDADLGSNALGAFYFKIAIDPPDANFTGINTINSGLSPAPVPTTNVPGFAIVSWDGGGSSITGTQQLFNLRFTAPIGTYSLTFVGFDETPGTELVDTDVAVITTTWNDGNFESLSNIPFKNWAIYIGFGLILAFMVVRFRRLF